MEMKMSGRVVAILFVAVVFVLMSGAEVSEAVTCNPIELSPCASAITTGNRPSAACCSKIREQRPCLCQYLNDPRLKTFISNPNARKVASTCGTPFPTC